MSEFVEALQRKLSELYDEREEHMDAVFRIDERTKVLNELLLEEIGEPIVPTPAPPSGPAPKPAAKKKRGRPKGSTNKGKSDKKKALKQKSDIDDLYEEARQELEKRGGGTTPEMQARLGGGKRGAAARPAPPEENVTKETSLEGRGSKTHLSIG
jgi:hypothetical protein